MGINEIPIIAITTNEKLFLTISHLPKKYPAQTQMLIHNTLAKTLNPIKRL